MGVQRVMVLTLGLPVDSRTMRAVADRGGWALEPSLLGLVVERLDALLYATAKIHGGKPAKPVPLVPRPEAVERGRRAERVDDVLAGLDRELARGGGAV